jgi:predicted amidohydrolase
MRVVLAQLASSTDSSANRAVVATVLEAAAEARPELVVLPEATMHDFGDPSHDLAASAEPLDGPFVDLLTTSARRLRATVVAGMFEVADALPYNTLVAVGPDGTLEATYRKVHLYDSFGYRESDRLAPGPVEPVVLDVAGHQVGLMTCYDLRFPELARLLVDAGADTVAVPAAWVSGPLKEDHWSALLRARAIENTVYVLGAAQCPPTYVGHSALVDPMGVVVAAAGEAPGLVVGEVDPARVANARARNPSLANRRIR